MFLPVHVTASSTPTPAFICAGSSDQRERRTVSCATACSALLACPSRDDLVIDRVAEPEPVPGGPFGRPPSAGSLVIVLRRLSRDGLLQRHVIVIDVRLRRRTPCSPRLAWAVANRVGG